MADEVTTPPEVLEPDAVQPPPASPGGIAGGAAKDASMLWWAIRPALRYPTLELRICDACTRLDDALAIAALYRCLVRRLVRRPADDAPRDPYARRLIDENRWRAKRSGLDATFLALDGGEPRACREVVGELLDAVAEDADALGATAALGRCARSSPRARARTRSSRCTKRDSAAETRHAPRSPSSSTGWRRRPTGRSSSRRRPGARLPNARRAFPMTACRTDTPASAPRPSRPKPTRAAGGTPARADRRDRRA